MKRLCGLLLAVTVAVAAGKVWSADVKIAVVDMARLVKAHPDTPSADALMEKQLEEFQAEQKDMDSEFDKMKKDFEEARKEAANKALSEQARDAKIQAAEEKLAGLRDYDRKMRETLGARQKQLGDQSMRMRKRIVDRIRATVQDYAADKGYALALDSAALSVSGVEVVLYSSDKIDITDDLLKVIAKEKPAAAKAPEAKIPEAKALESKPAEAKTP